MPLRAGQAMEGESQGYRSNRMGAGLYVCRSAAMSKSVMATAKDIYRDAKAENTELTSEETEAWLASIKGDRLVSDVFD